MRVKERIVSLLGLWLVGPCGLENVLRRGISRKQRVNLHHRNARIALDRNERRARFFNAVAARDAKEMPHGIFDVARVDGLVQFELLSAIGETAGIVTGDAALPVL